MPNEISERQLEIGLAWLDKEWNVPNRADHYAMLVSLTIRSMFEKGLELERMKIPFSFKEIAPAVDPATLSLGFPKPLTKEDVARLNSQLLKDEIQSRKKK